MHLARLINAENTHSPMPEPMNREAEPCRPVARQGRNHMKPSVNPTTGGRAKVPGHNQLRRRLMKIAAGVRTEFGSHEALRLVERDRLTHFNDVSVVH